MKKIIMVMIIFCMIIGIHSNCHAEAKKIIMNKQEVSIKQGESYKLKVKKTKKKVIWKSSIPSIATVDGKGEIKAKKNGETIITEKIGKKKYKYRVIVISKNKKPKDVSNLVYNNNKFTKSLYVKILKIKFETMSGEHKEITSSTGIKELFSKLASVKLTKIPKDEDLIQGAAILTIFTKDRKKIYIAINQEITFNGERYYPNKFIASKIIKLCRKYGK